MRRYDPLALYQNTTPREVERSTAAAKSGARVARHAWHGPCTLCLPVEFPAVVVWRAFMKTTQTPTPTSAGKILTSDRGMSQRRYLYLTYRHRCSFQETSHG